MAELLERCREEYERMLPQFEDCSGADLSRLRFFEVDEYLDFLEDNGQLTKELMMNFYISSPARYVHGEWCNLDVDAIVINEPLLEQRGISADYVMAHELSHASHAALARDYFMEDADRTWVCFTEGFALYFQTHCVDALPEWLHEFSDDIGQSLLDAYTSGEYDSNVERFTEPENKVHGYQFVVEAMEEAGDESFIFSMIANPPRSDRDLKYPHEYVARVKSDG